MFVGRVKELKLLNEIKSQNKSRLIVLSGRRRIGKSRLIEEFSKQFDIFLEFQGLAPNQNKIRDEDRNTKDQLLNFQQQFYLHSKLKLKSTTENKNKNNSFDHWLNAFSEVNNYLTKYSKKSKLLFLDEISWMAHGDPLFPGKLKIAWDTMFKKQANLIVVLCGSVSSWIQDNILMNKDFVGRISSQIHLNELNIQECSDFWFQQHKSFRKNLGITKEEIIKTVAVVGGVPRYLEEINPKLTFEANIQRICFSQEGMLVHEYEKIFHEIFNTKSKLYKLVLQTIAMRNYSASQIANHLNVPANGILFNCLRELELAGFIKRDFSWKLNNKTPAKQSHFRLKDNYVRFYLKYIEPIRSQILNGTKSISSLSELHQWPSVLGFQFENIVLNNIPEILQTLNINQQEISLMGPYFQNSTQTQQGVQIDLLIQDRFNGLYLFEIKCKNKIGCEVIKEVQEKIKKLKRPKGMSIRPGLIYLGELSEDLIHDDFFSYKVDFTSLIK
jgi:AAA+ ATPase superfamily predicted ATPase